MVSISSTAAGNMKKERWPPQPCWQSAALLSALASAVLAINGLQRSALEVARSPIAMEEMKKSVMKKSESAAEENPEQPTSGRTLGGSFGARFGGKKATHKNNLFHKAPPPSQEPPAPPRKQKSTLEVRILSYPHLTN